MKLYTFTEMMALMPSADVTLLQRFGWDQNGVRLRIDGVAGPKTTGATFYVPEEADQALVSVAMAEIVLGAQEEPLGRNSGRFVAKYYRKPQEIYQNLGAWCAAFAGWCVRQAYGEEAPYSWGARRLFKRALRWQDSHEVSFDEARPGDLIAWSRDSAGPANGHIGIVVGEEGPHLYTIEGNSGPFVRLFRYSKKDHLKRGSDRCLGIARLKPHV